MKSKLLLLTLSLILVSPKFFGQGINRIADNSLRTTALANEKLLLNESNDEKVAMSGFSLTDQSNEVLKLSLFCDVNTSPHPAETIIIFDNSDPEQGFEGNSNMDSTAPELWSVKNGQNYWINFMGDLDSTRNVPITVKAGLQGNYTLSYTEIASFGANIEIWLEDRVLKTSINLGISPDYTFQVSEASTISGRFFLRFVDIPTEPSTTITSISDREAVRPFNICASDGVITISSMQQQSGRVAVLDMSGRTVATGYIEAGTTSKIDLHNNKGVYVVSVNTDKGTINTKIIVK